MMAQRLLRTINGLLIALVVSVPLFYWKWTLYPYNVPKTALFEALVELIFALWVALAIADRRYRPKMTPLAWAIAAYLALLAVTAFAGVDAWRSFFSDLERAFGIVGYIHLAALALVVASLGRARAAEWKKIWYASFATALATVTIAAIQLRVPDLLLASDSTSGRPGSTFGNPTFLAGYLLFNIFLAGYFLLQKSSGQKLPSTGERWFLATTVVAGILGIFITETRGDIFGLFAGIVVLVILFAFRPPTSSEARSGSSIFSRRKFYVALLLIIVVAGAGIWFTRSSAVWNNVPGIDRLKDLTLTGVNSDIVPREIAATAAWQGFLARPLTGWGFENFNVVFNTYYNPKILEYGYAESNFDKPHDIVLEMLDAGGILLLLAYLAVLAGAIYEAWKIGKRNGGAGEESRLIGQFAAAAIIAYFVRSLVIFDTLGPALMLYIMFGWIDGKYQAIGAPDGLSPVKAGDKKIGGKIVAATLVVAAIVIYELNITAFAAGSFAWQGTEDIQLANQPAAGVAAFAADVATPNVYRWDYVRDYANTVAEAYFYAPTTIPTSTVMDAVAAMQQVTAEHPNDAYNHYFLADIYNLAYSIDPQDYLPAAIAQEQAALKLNPNRQEIYYYAAKTQSLGGDNVDALTTAQQALALDPNVADSHFYYGMLAFANGDNATGYNEIEAAIKMGRQWTDYYEPEIAGDYIADAGHVTDAIPLYLAALTLKSGDASTEMRLGAAYYFTGANASATTYFSAAVAQFNVASSPAYAQYAPILKALGISTE